MQCSLLFIFFPPAFSLSSGKMIEFHAVNWGYWVVLPLKFWSIDCMDSQCPLAITSLLTMCYQGRAVQALKGFPRLYFSLSLSTWCAESKPGAGFKGRRRPRAMAVRELVVPVSCFMARHKITDFLGARDTWDACPTLLGSITPALGSFRSYWETANTLYSQ